MKDGYTKYGVVIEQTDDFISIRYETREGSEQIALATVASIKDAR
jgi:hypothetical protein